MFRSLALVGVMLLTVLQAFSAGPVSAPVSAQSRAVTRTVMTVTTDPATPDVVTLTATVSSEAGRVTGPVQFLDGGAPVGRSALMAVEGQTTATFQVRLAPGRHPMSARYLGNDNYAASASPMVMVARAR